MFTDIAGQYWSNGGISRGNSAAPVAISLADATSSQQLWQIGN